MDRYWSPNRRKIGDLSEALAAVCILQSDIDQPTWLDGRTTGVMVAVANGLLDVERRLLFAHTPQFFNQTAVPFDYRPEAPQPTRWLAFLNELWPNEPAAIAVLSEWFGYVIRCCRPSKNPQDGQLDRADAARLAANAEIFDRTVVLYNCSGALRQSLEDRGYKIIEVPLHAFIRSGGSACCLTLRLDHQSSRSGLPDLAARAAWRYSPRSAGPRPM